MKVATFTHSFLRFLFVFALHRARVTDGLERAGAVGSETRGRRLGVCDRRACARVRKLKDARESDHARGARKRGRGRDRGAHDERSRG